MPAAGKDVLSESRRAMLLTALYMAQEQYGYLSPEALERVAARLDMRPQEVYAAATFYSMFRFRPVGRHVLQVCEGLSCYLAGGAELLVSHLERVLGIKVGETTADGGLTLQTVQCLASCGSAPTLKVDDTLYENMTPDRVDMLLRDLGWEG